jgi:two-component system response regulator FlrC
VILQGETGTGKEGAARAIHQWSGRAGPFLAVNCAALPEALAEAELFGYRRGAFTGADRASPGFFRAADGGTLLLDEIVDLPLVLQAKLLRVLEQKEVQPLGFTTPVPVDVRVVAACQKPLQIAVDEKRFRADLYARLDGVTVNLPPLRERIEEIPYLLVQLLHRHRGGTSPPHEPKLVEQLCLYEWPFNVREVDLLMRRLLVLHGSEPILRRSHLPERFRIARTKSTAGQPRIQSVVTPAVEQEHRDERDLAAFVANLPINGGNLARASAAAGISRQRAYRLIEANPSINWAELRRGGEE